jgi:7-cyano-7-deazaguanine synthase in queuosine biosynthesis
MVRGATEEEDVRKISCVAQRLRTKFGAQTCAFDADAPDGLIHHVSGELGPSGLSPVAADLLDIAGCVYRIERALPPPGKTNAYTNYRVSIPLRSPDRWNAEALAALGDALELLGGATWQFALTRAKTAVNVADESKRSTRRIDSVALFSGGVDSSCGAATLKGHNVQLCSFYTRQKARQLELARALDLAEPTQWTIARSVGRGRSFSYRSFLFLAQAAVVAQSWGARKILQFENGVLASSIPPSEAFVITKHAYPTFHRHLERLFRALFGGQWTITNPFAKQTKREVVKEMRARLGPQRTAHLLAKIDTCWSHWAPHVHGHRKRPGMPCGVCVPCLVRRTALPDEKYHIDLTKARWQNDLVIGGSFRAYFAFLESVRRCRSDAEFFQLLPGQGRRLVTSGDGLDIDEALALFRRFQKEFSQTFKVRLIRAR